MTTRLTAVALPLLFAAGIASAADVRTVLTPDSVAYSVAASGQHHQIEITRRTADARETLVVPGTDDETLESDVHLAFDSCSNLLFVLWHRVDGETDEIRLMTRNGAGEWSAPFTIGAGTDRRRAGLEMVMTRARGEGDDVDTTIIHAAWWGVGMEFIPEYAVVAFQRGEHVSTSVADLRDLAAQPTDDESGAESDWPFEDMGEAAHPPLALSRAEKAVDVVFGSDHTSSVTRLRVEPGRVETNARMWRPLGRSAQRTTPAHVTSNSTAPVQAIIIKDRIVLYSPEAKFRFSVYDEGRWSPVRMIGLDEQLTSDQLVQELRRNIENDEFRNAPEDKEEQ
jgi:hypothetical protein